MKDDLEVWKDIPGYGNYFQASSFGRIKRKARIVVKFSAVAGRNVQQRYGELILSPSAGPHGHLRCHISVDRKKINLAVHRLVLLAFVGPCPEGMEACHGDGVPSNNRPSNLRWDTSAGNAADRRAHGRYAVGAAHHFAKLTADQVLLIRGASSHVDAARVAGVSYKMAWRVRKGETWAGVPN